MIPLIVDLETEWRGGQNQALLTAKGMRESGHDAQVGGNSRFPAGTAGGASRDSSTRSSYKSEAGRRGACAAQTAFPRANSISCMRTNHMR